MSYPRKGCFKCGNVGHFANACQEPERLCYNCKEPGHESNLCPVPRSADAKQCYSCGGVGHIQADCPTIRISGGAGGRCYNCGMFGHMARNCRNQPRYDHPSHHGQFNDMNMNMGMGMGAGMRAIRGGGYMNAGSHGRIVICYKCGGPNHFARDCKASAVKCYNCGKLNHISRDCPSLIGGVVDASIKTCYRCGVQGHISRDCTTTKTAAATSDPAEA